jgi:hypothetical protein
LVTTTYKEEENMNSTANINNESARERPPTPQDNQDIQRMRPDIEHWRTRDRAAAEAASNEQEAAAQEANVTQSEEDYGAEGLDENKKRTSTKNTVH